MEESNNKNMVDGPTVRVERHLKDDILLKTMIQKGNLMIRAVAEGMKFLLKIILML